MAGTSVPSDTLTVGFFSLTDNSCVKDFIGNIAAKTVKIKPTFVKLTAKALEYYDSSDNFDAVILLHSIAEGRFCITDVADAKYNQLLKSLCEKYGPSRVGVIAHSMPNFSETTKAVQMMMFKGTQPTTFQCSECVILCGNISKMPDDEWIQVTNFLTDLPNHPLPGKNEVKELCQEYEHPNNGKRNTRGPPYNGTVQNMPDAANQTGKGNESHDRAKGAALSNESKMEPNTSSRKRGGAGDDTFPVALLKYKGSTTNLKDIKDALLTLFPDKTFIDIEGGHEAPEGLWRIAVAVFFDCHPSGPYPDITHISQKLAVKDGIGILHTSEQEPQIVQGHGSQHQRDVGPQFWFPYTKVDEKIEFQDKTVLQDWLEGCTHKFNTSVTAERENIWAQFKATMKEFDLASLKRFFLSVIRPKSATKKK